MEEEYKKFHIQEIMKAHREIQQFWGVWAGAFPQELSYLIPSSAEERNLEGYSSLIASLHIAPGKAISLNKHRIIESFWSEKTFKILESSC